MEHRVIQVVTVNVTKQQRLLLNSRLLTFCFMSPPLSFSYFELLITNMIAASPCSSRDVWLRLAVEVWCFIIILNVHVNVDFSWKQAQGNQMSFTTRWCDDLMRNGNETSTVATLENSTILSQPTQRTLFIFGLQWLTCWSRDNPVAI